jgi:hypothetical protein
MYRLGPKAAVWKVDWTYQVRLSASRAASPARAGAAQKRQEGQGGQGDRGGKTAAHGAPLLGLGLGVMSLPYGRAAPMGRPVQFAAGACSLRP